MTELDMTKERLKVVDKAITSNEEEVRRLALELEGFEDILVQLKQERVQLLGELRKLNPFKIV